MIMQGSGGGGACDGYRHGIPSHLDSRIGQRRVRSVLCALDI